MGFRFDFAKGVLRQALLAVIETPEAVQEASESAAHTPLILGMPVGHRNRYRIHCSAGQ